MKTTRIRFELSKLTRRLCREGLALPGHCVVCEFPLLTAQNLCHDCAANLPWAGPSCPRCGLPMDTEREPTPCGRCVVDPPPFDRCAALFHYRPPVDGLIARFKYHADFACGRMLGRLLAERFTVAHTGPMPAGSASAMPAVLIPTPLHPGRLKERGFNQALELARAVSRYSGRPIRLDLIHRKIPTPAQSQLTARQRLNNVQNAFRVADARDHRSGGLHVALIDDVVTTAATVTALARTLRRYGVTRIDVWALARAG